MYSANNEQENVLARSLFFTVRPLRSQCSFFRYSGAWCVVVMVVVMLASTERVNCSLQHVTHVPQFLQRGSAQCIDQLTAQSQLLIVTNAIFIFIIVIFVMET